MFYTFYCTRCGKEIIRDIPNGISIKTVILSCDECRKEADKEPVQLKFDFEKDVNQ